LAGLAASTARDTQGVDRRMIALTLGYIVFRLDVLRARRIDDEGFGAVGDAVSFSVSALLLLGVSYPRIVRSAIGDTTPFLVFSGLGGIYHAIMTPFRT